RARAAPRRSRSPSPASTASGGARARRGPAPDPRKSTPGRRRARQPRRAREGDAMLIVDAQVHIWSSGKPTNPNHRQVPAYTKDDLLKEMDEAGGNAALIHPPASWGPSSNELA